MYDFIKFFKNGVKKFFFRQISNLKFLVLFMYFLPFYDTLGVLIRLLKVFESEIFLARNFYRSRKIAPKMHHFDFWFVLFTPFQGSEISGRFQKIFFFSKVQTLIKNIFRSHRNPSISKKGTSFFPDLVKKAKKCRKRTFGLKMP